MTQALDITFDEWQKAENIIDRWFTVNSIPFSD